MITSNCKIWLAEKELSGDMDRLKVAIRANTVPDLRFGCAFRNSSQPGIPDGLIDYDGFVSYGAGSMDEALQGYFNIDEVPIATAAAGGNVGDLAWFMKSLHTKYEKGGRIGEAFKCQIAAEGSGQNNHLVMGQIFEAGSTERTASGNSGVIQLGNVAAGKKVYAQVHVLEFAGSSLTIKLRSAVTNFATITDRITTAFDGVGAEYGTPVAGSITDTYWRFDWTGTFTSFKALCVAGIQ